MVGEWAFRLPFLLQMVPAIAVGTCVHFFPYSPRWLWYVNTFHRAGQALMFTFSHSMRGRNEESLKSLSKLRVLSEEDPRVQTEWKGIIAEVHLEREVLHKRHGDISNGIMMELKAWGDLFTRRYRKRTAVAMAVPFFQQVSPGRFFSRKRYNTNYSCSSPASTLSCTTRQSSSLLLARIIICR